VKILLIGLGRWGEKHLRVLCELGADVWVADRGAERRALAMQAGVPPSRVVADFRQALPHVDAVDVVTPADGHLALASAALRAGKACFVEKPLTLTAGEGLELAGVVTATGGLLQVGHVFRFHPVTEVLRRHLETGALGRIRYATARFAGFKRPRADVGVTRADALHCYDLLAYLLGSAPSAVTATISDHLSRGLDDCSFSMVEYGPVGAFVEASYFAPPTSRECVIVGDQATMVADFTAAQVRLHASRHVPGATGWEACEGPVEVIAAEGPEPLKRELALFLEAATGGLPSPVGVEAGILALRVVEAAELSSRLRRRVGLDEIDRVDGSVRRQSSAGTAPAGRRPGPEGRAGRQRLLVSPDEPDSPLPG
jgi:UDP-N-acetylglucosamine 3-dehydrogenase